MEYEGFDIDWFFIDKYGRIAHAASNGGDIPLSVKRLSDDLNGVLVSYFRALPSITDFKVSEHLQSYIDSIKVDVNSYLADFKMMASKGLYSFDKTNASSHGTRYHLVTAPVKALEIDELPDAIFKIIKKTSFDADLSSILKFDVNDVL